MRKYRRLKAVAGIAVLAVLALGLRPGAAGAGTSSSNDPDDTTGLDLAAVSITDDPYLVTFKADTYEPFDNETGFYQLRWDLDFDGDGVLNETGDACVLVEQNGSGGLRASLRDACGDNIGGTAEVTKSAEGGGERISFAFLNSELRSAGLDAGATSFKYRVESFDLATGNDLVPDDATPTTSFVLLDHTGMAAAVTPQFTVNGPSVTEPDDPSDAGLVNLSFTVTMTPAIGASFPYQAEVDVATANGTATASNTVGVGDYKSKTAHLVFDNDDTAKTVDVQVKGDALDEVDETLTLATSNGSLGPAGAQRAGGAVGGTSGTGTILDNDAPPTVSVGDATAAEGGTATFTVSLSAASAKTITVEASSANGTAVAGSDYTALGTTTLTYTPGQTSKTVDVTTLGDSLDENDETFDVNLANPSNASIGDGQGVGTITDDAADGPPSLSINDRIQKEGKKGFAPMTFTVTLSAASGKTVTVDFATAPGKAKPGTDYTHTFGTLTFAPGETTKTIAVPIKGDRKVEKKETFLVNLTNATNATIADGQGVGIIKNDDR